MTEQQVLNQERKDPMTEETAASQALVWLVRIALAGFGGLTLWHGLDADNWFEQLLAQHSGVELLLAAIRPPQREEERV